MSDSDTPILKPCPFCESPAEDAPGNGWPGERIVRCTNEECGVEASCVWESKSAADVWNRRPNQTPDLVKELCAAINTGVRMVFWICPNGCQGTVRWNEEKTDATCGVCGTQKSDHPKEKSHEQ